MIRVASCSLRTITRCGLLAPANLAESGGTVQSCQVTWPEPLRDSFRFILVYPDGSPESCPRPLLARIFGR